MPWPRKPAGMVIRPFTAGSPCSSTISPCPERADGSYGKLLQKLAKVRVLVVDDWGLAPLEEMERRDFLEILEDRHNSSSTIMSSQLPIKKWHDTIGDPTLADAICDRIVHNAHKITLKGESVRKIKSTLDENGPSVRS